MAKKKEEEKHEFHRAEKKEIKHKAHHAEEAHDEEGLKIEKHVEHPEHHEKKEESHYSILTFALLAVVIIVTAFNAFTISSLSVTGSASGGNLQLSGASLEEAVTAVVPTGVPAVYGSKYLLQNHPEMTNDQILEELGKWKTLFFPSTLAQKALVLKEKGIELNYINLASNKYRGIEKGEVQSGSSMVGGC